MKQLLFILVTVVLCGAATLGKAADQNRQAPRLASRVQHIVCFKFKAGTTDAQITAMEKEFAALKGKVDGLIAFEHGRNNSPEGLSKGFTHCYIATFKSLADRDAYLPHAAHQEFVSKHLKPILDDVFVIDFGGN